MSEMESSMGLMLVTSERMQELENEVESYKIGYAKLIKEHDNMQRAYRELRKIKDNEIADLHVEIEDYKSQIAMLMRENKRLRQVVKWYEDRRNVSAVNTVSAH